MGLHRYWPLNETGGTTALETVSGTNANVIGDAAGASAVAAKFGYGRDFSLGDGGTSYLRLWPGTADNAVYSEWSAVCWFRRDDATGGDWLHLFNIGNYAGGGKTTLNAYFFGGELFVDLRNGTNNLVDRASHIATYFGNGWHHLAITCDGSIVRMYVDGALVDSTALPLAITPDTSDSYFGFETTDGAGDVFADDIAIFTSALSAADVSALWNGGTGATVADLLTLSASISVPSPIGAPAVFAVNDWTATVPQSSQIYYAAELRGGGTVLRLPISSWQATIQTDRQSYLQCVVPAAESYIDAINAIGLFSSLAIIRGALRPNGSKVELDMAVVPLQQLPYQRGPQRSTVTLSGYGVILSPPLGAPRPLTGLQTISADQGGTRVRCQIDWLLRPGMIAIADDLAFDVAYINYYGNATQEFMDVGSRPL